MMRQKGGGSTKKKYDFELGTGSMNFFLLWEGGLGKISTLG